MKLALFAVVLLLFLATGIITLLGIIQRVEIERKYLNALFSALILELIAAVLFLFSGTDFFSQPSVDEKVMREVAFFIEQHPEVYVPDLLAQGMQAGQLSAFLRDERAAHAKDGQTLVQLQSELDALQSKLAQRNDQIKWLNEELEARKEATLRLAKLERQFLVRMSELNSKISEWGTSVNFSWQPEEKREIALMLQEAFKEIGFMEELEIPNDDPLLANDILTRYQSEKNFKEVGFLTHQTIAFIIQDYLKSPL
ncbi:hypothetical protein [Reinekea sp. G2M2-21]|uniref:hypothetical protein n=1 Tax=Reinekea sp. G2M2-21 TaxID=2788942 RepID=UPI0018A9B955|nr:hypothetical protein [Reinekea sp. G2M2-21]